MKIIVILLKDGSTIELPDLEDPQSIADYKAMIGWDDDDFQKICKFVLENRSAIF